MSNINKDAVLNPFSDLTANILDYVPRATTSEFGIVAIGSGINVDTLGRIYLDTQEYSDRLTAIEAQAASSLATQQTEVAAAIAQVNLTQSQTITALTLEVNTLKTNLTNEIAATETNLINRADQLAQDVTDITEQLTQEIQDALVYLEGQASTATALRTPRKIQGVDFDGTQDISLPVFTSQTDGLVPKRVGATSTKYLCEDGSWVTPPNTTYATLTQANAETGTSTTANTISAKVLKDAIQFHAPTVTDITGNAGTAIKLQTPRTIGGVSFDGTANINLPGVNIAGNQSTSGNAGSATKFQTPRTINGVSFDGTQNITVPTTGIVGISYGGTGGTNAAEARTNLGLGSAATKNAGESLGNVIGVGDFGFGGNSSGSVGSFETYRRNRFVASQPGTPGYPGSFALGYQLNGADEWQVYLMQEVANNNIYFGRRPSPAEPIHWSLARTTANTTVDGNGFIKAASPVIQLFSDHIELNDEAKLQEITFEKLGVGNYLIKGSTGLAQEGWYIEQPKDSNGNIYHAVEYGTHPNGDIWLKTYEQMMDGTRIVADHTKPTDIIKNRFISIRLNALPKDTSAPINPTIKDNEGNAAPSRLHELVNGVWEISDENAAILEQERLAAMKPLKRRQFRLTLAMNGYDLNEIEALINQIEDPMQRTIAQIEWQDATDFERTNPTLLMMVQMLELTSEQVDSLWEYGLAL